MTSLLITFLIVVVVPLLTANWRWSLFGLSAQGLLLGVIAARRGAPLDASGAVLLLDFVVVRAALGPRMLAGILIRLHVSPRQEVIPGNLLFWTAAAVLIGLALGFAGVMAPGPRAQQVHLGVSVAALLLALLVLATKNTTLSQIIGVLRLENAIALFELTGERHHPLPVQLGFSAVYAASLILFGSFLNAPRQPVVPPGTGAGSPP